METGSWVSSQFFHVNALGLSLFASLFEETYGTDFPQGMARDELFLSNVWLIEGSCVLTGMKQGQQSSLLASGRRGSLGSIWSRTPENSLTHIHLLAIYVKFQPV